MGGLFGDMLDQLQEFLVSKIKAGTDNEKRTVLNTPTKKSYSGNGLDIGNYGH